MIVLTLVIKNTPTYIIVLLAWTVFQVICMGKYSDTKETDLLINPGAWLIQPAVVISIVLSIFIYQKQRKIEKEDQIQKSNQGTPQSRLTQSRAYNNQVPKSLGGFIVKCVGLVMMSLTTLNNSILERYEFRIIIGYHTNTIITCS